MVAASRQAGCTRTTSAVGSGAFRYTFLAHSVTVIQLTR